MAGRVGGGGAFQNQRYKVILSKSYKKTSIQKGHLMKAKKIRIYADSTV
jgi:hypothetical protein